MHSAMSVARNIQQQLVFENADPKGYFGGWGKLGAGASGTVYRCNPVRDPKGKVGCGGRPEVAVKVSSIKEREYIETEIGLQMLCKHPNIVAVLSPCFIHQSDIYIPMEIMAACLTDIIMYAATQRDSERASLPCVALRLCLTRLVPALSLRCPCVIPSLSLRCAWHRSEGMRPSRSPRWRS